MSSIQPLFSGPLLMPSRQLVDASNPPDADVPSDVDVDNGPTTGNVLDGDGNDFLNPDKIQDITDDFSDSVHPVTSDTLRTQIFPAQPLPKNPDATDILNATLKGLDRVFDPNIGQGVLPRANSNPIFWRNPTPLDIFVGTSAISGSLISGDNVIQDLFPSNPTINNPLSPGFDPLFPPGPSDGGITVPNFPIFPPSSVFPTFPSFPTTPSPTPSPGATLPPELINTYMSLLASSSQLMTMMAQTLGLSTQGVSSPAAINPQILLQSGTIAL